MDSELLTSGIAAVAAVAAAILAARAQLQVTQLTGQMERERRREDRAADHEQAIARFREPLAQAAYDLQSRLFNLLERNLVGAFVDRGSERSRQYVIANTVFLIAQYFAWTEIIRTEILFIDLGASEPTRRLSQLRDRIFSLWQTDSLGPELRVFAGEQRAIGETLIRRDGTRVGCIGYAEFLAQDTPPHSLRQVLWAEVEALTRDLPAARPRLVALQNALIDLLDFLDPDHLRFPKANRTKVVA